MSYLSDILNLVKLNLTLFGFIRLQKISASKQSQIILSIEHAYLVIL
jgi:hypothetical protein